TPMTNLGNFTLSSGTMTLAGTGGEDVYAVNNFTMNSLNSATLILSGGPKDQFVFNVSGSFLMLGFGNQIVLNGISPGQVLFNFLGSNSNTVVINGEGNTAAGTFLALKQVLQVVGTNRVDGALISGGSAFQITGNNSIDAVAFGTIPEPCSLVLAATG